LRSTDGDPGFLERRVEFPANVFEQLPWLGSFQNMGWRCGCLSMLHEEAERGVRGKVFDIYLLLL